MQALPSFRFKYTLKFNSGGINYDDKDASGDYGPHFKPKLIEFLPIAVKTEWLLLGYKTKKDADY